MENLKYQMENDSRFKINDEAMESLFKNHLIYDYKLDKIPLGRIRRTIGKKIYKLEDTINYKLIIDRNNAFLNEEYNIYSTEENNLKDNSSRSLATFNALIDRLNKEEYSLKKGAIIVNQFNFIIDGLHRSCILLSQYGEEHIIEVVRVKSKIAKRMYFKAPIFELIQLIKRKKQ